VNGFDAMKRHLHRQWRLAGIFEFLDIENGFFVAKFDSKEDKIKQRLSKEFLGT
jgi:hypothetical protein